MDNFGSPLSSIVTLVIAIAKSLTLYPQDRDIIYGRSLYELPIQHLAHQTYLHLVCKLTEVLQSVGS